MNELLALALLMNWPLRAYKLAKKVEQWQLEVTWVQALRATILADLAPASTGERSRPDFMCSPS